MKRIVYSLLAALTITSCGDDELKNPNYPIEPSIRFMDLKFKDDNFDDSPFEQLILTISYKDGDSDLGLKYDEVAPPYHYHNLFLANGTGDTTMIPANLEPLYSDDYPVIVVKPVSQTGTLVTSSTREKPGYEYLPEHNPLANCPDYTIRPFYYFDEKILDESFDVRYTIAYNNENFKSVNDPVLIQQNENSYNIFIKFYQFDNGSYVEYEWPGCQTYNGRFPLIEDKKSGTIDGGPFQVKVKNPWEGEITFTMLNSAFLATFGNRSLKLEITIKDRALHTSNTIITRAFELNEIQ